jgi:hypothetical protein
MEHLCCLCPLVGVTPPVTAPQTWLGAAQIQRLGPVGRELEPAPGLARGLRCPCVWRADGRRVAGAVAGLRKVCVCV